MTSGHGWEVIFPHFDGKYLVTKHQKKTPSKKLFSWTITFSQLVYVYTSKLGLIIYLILTYIVNFRCDRILWRGEGIEQLSYIRGESRFSDHRPVCAVFAVDVEAEAEAEANNNSKFRKGFSCTATRLEYEDLIPLRHSSYHYWIRNSSN